LNQYKYIVILFFFYTDRVNLKENSLGCFIASIIAEILIGDKCELILSHARNADKCKVILPYVRNVIFNYKTYEAFPLELQYIEESATYSYKENVLLFC